MRPPTRARLDEAVRLASRLDREGIAGFSLPIEMQGLLEEYYMLGMWPDSWFDGQSPLLFRELFIPWGDEPVFREDAVSIASDLPNIITVIQIAKELKQQIEYRAAENEEKITWLWPKFMYRSYNPKERIPNMMVSKNIDRVFEGEVPEVYIKSVVWSENQPMKEIVMMGYMPVVEFIQKSSGTSAALGIFYPKL